MRLEAIVLDVERRSILESRQVPLGSHDGIEEIERAEMPGRGGLEVVGSVAGIVGSTSFEAEHDAVRRIHRRAEDAKQTNSADCGRATQNVAEAQVDARAWKVVRQG